MPDTTTLTPPGTLLHTGKAKSVHAVENPDERIIDFSDRATAGNGEKAAEFTGKGEVNAAITYRLFTMLAEHGVTTHLLKAESATQHRVHAATVVPLEVIVRNIAAGSMVRRTGITPGTQLDPPIVEFSLKDDDLGDPLVTTQHIGALNIISSAELSTIEARARLINVLLRENLAKANLILVDFKLEFGHSLDDGRLMLIDEISPDTCRLWDADTMDVLDKDRFRNDMGDVMSAYDEVLQRLNAADIGEGAPA